MSYRIKSVCRAALALVLVGLSVFCPPGRAVEVDLTEKREESEGFLLEVLSVSREIRHRGRVYLYHTHTYEAYEPDSSDPYKPTESYRTADENHNMLRIGAELTRYLENAGITVTHDQTVYEMPKLSTAYSRSLEGISAAAREGYDLYIDLHRDSYSKGNGPNTVETDSGMTARFLFLIGQGTGTGFDERPDWEKNQKAAQWISDSLNRRFPGISRGVSLKSGRYNQQAASPSMLIEVGNNKNTLQEALTAIPILANVLCEYFDTLE